MTPTSFNTETFPPECSICLGVESGSLGQVVGPDHPQKLNHWFHQDCFSRWVNALPPLTCPLCRRRITQIIVEGVEISIIAPVTINEHPLVLAAIANSLPEVENLLLQENISPETFSVALRSAMTQGSEDIVLAIIPHALLPEGGISEEARENALQAAVSGGFSRVVERFLDNRPISNVSFGNLVDIAILRDDTEILQTFLARPQMSAPIRSAGLLLSAQEGRQEAVLALLASGSVPLSSLSEACKEAIKKGFLKIALVLLVKAFSQFLFAQETIIALFGLMVLFFAMYHQLSERGGYGSN